METSKVVLSYGESLVLSVWSGGRTREVEVGAGNCTSVAGMIAACSMQNCVDALCFPDVGAVAADDWVALAEDGVGVTEEDAEKTEVKDGLE